MNILNGLRVAWIKLGENKKNNDMQFNKDIVYSEDNELIEKKLDEILEKLCQIDCSNKSSLRDSLYCIFNRESEIYPSGKKNHKWKYRLVINKEDGTHHFELSVDGEKIMLIDTKATLNGILLDFNAMYRTDVTEYLGNKINKGTTFVKIDCHNAEGITFENNVYCLDLLNNNYSKELVEENCVSEVKVPLSVGRTLK